LYIPIVVKAKYKNVTQPNPLQPLKFWTQPNPSVDRRYGTWCRENSQTTTGKAGKRQLTNVIWERDN